MRNRRIATILASSLAGLLLLPFSAWPARNLMTGSGAEMAALVRPVDGGPLMDSIDQSRLEAAVLVVTGTNEKGQAPQSQTARAKVEYWDYWRSMDIGAGKTAKEFIFVEMNSDTGWFQIWRGREFFQ